MSVGDRDRLRAASDRAIEAMRRHRTPVVYLSEEDARWVELSFFIGVLVPVVAGAPVGVTHRPGLIVDVGDRE